MPARATSIPTRRRALSGVAAATMLVAIAGCSGATTDDESSIVRTTTMVAGAGVVGLGRDTATACPTPTPPDSPDVDPQRIVVLSTQALDTACALGVWERVVGAVTPDAGTQPKFFGDGIAKIPSVGSMAAPDVAKIAALKPDLILGTTPPRPDVIGKLQGIAATTFDNLFPDWKQEFLAGAEALGRRQAGQQALDDFQRQATDTAVQLGASQSEASVVRFTADGAQIEGNDTFAGRILADASVRRPASQRGGSFDLDTADPKAADADLIYVIFDGEKGKEHGTDVMTTDAWEKLGAVDDHRVFTVADAIWNGTGLTAAKAVLSDLHESLNGYTN
ncbi:ABC transporter substrate-binding protein [Antrihabitans cavernicola]|uniref:ABC transporter substrate-binding protein n=1 Tax=Antrihabitans cavernicola TaxID=2495913 RepID=A0A5A7SG53_9NOCA|nr:ABC transporter substrate-binding protein [Spelaeibacter cavernicola]KAA0024172.1 ABC transporter substrate-binding protein [Spelaeibacter cavernicola]